jgi:hypothetical protein
LSEDAAKVDMKFSLRHAFRSSKLMTIHAQVKSGRSYRLRSSNEKQLNLDIDRETINALSGSGTPGLVVWVPPAPLDRLYWYANDPRRLLRSSVKISRQQFVRPSIAYDLTRLFEYSSWTRSFSMQTTAELPDESVHTRAKQTYAALKSTEWVHPLAGKLAVTRLAWRHITRRSKSKARRSLALRVAPYLKAFLGKAPDRYVCNQGPIELFGTQMRETRYLLCWYRGALSIRGESYSLLIRIKEEIAYPANWQERPIGSADVSQMATLASWWCKKE